MPRIFDNIDQHLLPALEETLKISERADSCVEYFNIRGRRSLNQLLERRGRGKTGRVLPLVGMQVLPQDELRGALSFLGSQTDVDQQGALRLKRRMAEEFREQLTLGAPSNADEAGLRRLSRQLKAKKVVVKLFLRHPLHAK